MIEDCAFPFPCSLNEKCIGLGGVMQLLDGLLKLVLSSTDGGVGRHSQSTCVLGAIVPLFACFSVSTVGTCIVFNVLRTTYTQTTVRILVRWSMDPRRMIFSMEAVLPTPPSSSCEDDQEDEGERDGLPAEEQAEAEAVAATAETTGQEMSINEWYKNSPIYSNLQCALEDISYEEHRTSSHKNCCLLFAYMRCTNEMGEAEQYTRLARMRSYA